MSDRVAVASADFIRNIGYWQSEALRCPISITHHGRERLILAAPERFNSPEEASQDAQRQHAALLTEQTALLENLDEGFIRFNTHFQIDAINAVAEAFLGLSRETARNRTAFDVFPDLLASLWRNHMDRVARTRKPESFDAEGAQGAHIRVRMFPMPEGVGCLFHNVTETINLRREREEGDALSKALERHAGVAVVRLDARGRIGAANDNFCRWSGFAESEVMGFRLVDLVAGARRAPVGAALERVMRERAPECVDVTIISKKGAEASGELALAPITTDFNTRGVLGVCLARREPALAPGA